VRIIGFKTLPKAGDPITCVESEEKAEQLIERRILMGGSEQSYRSEDDGPASLEVTGVAAQHVNLQRIHDKYDLEIGASTDTVRIPIIIKADADGTLAALRESMVAIGKESFLDIIIDPIGQGIGPITISDVEMANLSNAAIFSFNVKQTDNKEALAMIETEGVSMKSNNVIYSLLDDAKDIFANYLPTTRVEHIHGKATIQAIFEINNSAERAKIAGLRVTSGAMHREKASTGGSPAVTCHYRVMRSGEQISPKGEHVTASSLKKVKTDVLEVKKGEECGLGLEGYHNYQEGDIIECYSVLEQKVKI
jgi:translation initiation factor IF-2